MKNNSMILVYSTPVFILHGAMYDYSAPIETVSKNSGFRKFIRSFTKTKCNFNITAQYSTLTYYCNLATTVNSTYVRYRKGVHFCQKLQVTNSYSKRFIKSQRQHQRQRQMSCSVRTNANNYSILNIALFN